MPLYEDVEASQEALGSLSQLNASLFRLAETLRRDDIQRLLSKKEKYKFQHPRILPLIFKPLQREKKNENIILHNYTSYM